MGCLGISTAISGEILAMSNCSWKFSIREFGNTLAVSHLRILNDFNTMAMFRTRFEEKGRFCSYLEQIPTWVINAPWPRLMGEVHSLDDDTNQFGHIP
jgi:glucokinase